MRLIKRKLTRTKILLLLIILIGGGLRICNINWDNSFSLHPDERAIVMTTLKLELPNSLENFLSKDSPLNPKFFAYGSLPFYLLKTFSTIIGPPFTQYGTINIIGRLTSTIADLITIIIIFLLGRKILTTNVGLFASSFYAISVFPIQASHFFAVDILLSCFITITLYRLIIFYEKPSIKNSILVGAFFGLALATKVSAFPLIIAILSAIGIDFILVFLKSPHRIQVWFPHIPKLIKKLSKDIILIGFTTALIFVIASPYALIDLNEFLKQNLLQSQMTKDPFTFPYTLQYVGKIPYLYELKNIFLWGLGPILATLSFCGIIFFTINIFRKMKTDTKFKEIIILIFFITYFAIVGKFAVGWMRYMLPLYPLLCLFAAIFTIQYLKPKFDIYTKSKLILHTFYFILASLLLIWPAAFINIFTQPNTRFEASKWIHNNIPQGSKIAVEHWDDRLPLYDSYKYVITDLPLYDPETQFKWMMIGQTLQNVDYIILASNRLYIPLQKLTDCSRLPLYKCYRETADYYKRLFNGNLGFLKVAEFTSYPAIVIGNLKFEIHDDTADESFTVYDHPKVMIFKKITR